MATLETQYKNFLREHPESTLTFDEWLKQFGEGIKSSMQKLFDEIKSAEYKEEQIKENQEYLDKVTMDYQLGEYVGEYIISHWLPTLSTDMIQSRNVIEVSEEDVAENKRLNDEWFATTRYNDDWDGENDGNNDKWELYFQNNKMLEKKYLPNPFVCHLRMVKFNDENEFKRGIQDRLWDCDMCSYDIEIENIKIEYEMEWGFTKFSFQLNEK